MPKSLKIIFIVLLMCNLMCLHQNAFAWQQQDSTKQVRFDDDASADTVVETDDATTEVAPEPESEDEREASFREYNFDTTSEAPSRVNRSLNDASWERLKNDPDYKYYEEAQKEEKPPVDYSKSWWVRMFEAIFDFFRSDLGKGFVIFVVVMIVIILIARAIQLNGNIFFSKKDKKIGNNEDEQDDDYIPENWNDVITAAAKSGNYRLALRHCYRYLLTSLGEKELIQFQVAKTNYQYVYELSGTAYHKPFMKLTRDYEYAWYGGFEIDEEFFKNYYQMTQNIQQQLNH